MTGRRLLVGLLLVVSVAVVWWVGTAEENRLFALTAESGQVVWSAGLPRGTHVAGVPAVAEGRVVLSLGLRGPLADGNEQWQLAAFDVATGRTLWEYVPPPEQRRRLHTIDMVLATPHVTADRVFVRLEGSDISSLLALDAATGHPAWTLDAPLAFGHDSRHTDLMSHGGRILVPTREGDGLLLRALDTQTGAELWRVPVEREALPRTDLGSFFAASDDTFYAGLSRGVLALDATSGAVRFRVDEPEDERGGQIWLDGGTLYRRNSLRSIVALDATTGAPRWTYREPSPGNSVFLKSFAVREGLLTVQCACDGEQGRDQGMLIAVDAGSGVERWRAPLDAYIELYQTWPAQASGIVVEATEHDDVVARSMADGATRWRVPREIGLGVAADDSRVFASDRAPRWRHWLRMVGINSAP